MASTDAVGSRASHFVHANRKALLIGAAGMTAVAASAAGYYYYASSASTSDADNNKGKDSGSGANAGEKKKSKNKKKSKKSASSAGKEAPEDAGQANQHKASVEDEKSPAGDALSATSEQIQAMSKQDRADKAVTLKSQGNKFYSSKKYNQAVTYYSKAIEFEEQAVFYSNRAACYTNLSMPDKVIEDCSSALRLDKTYVKALNRRAAVLEQKGDQDSLYKALCDYTAGAILGQFQASGVTDGVDRVMKRLAAVQAQDIIAGREARLPSSTFIRAYMDAFRKQPPLSLPDSPAQGDQTLKLALDANEAGDYAHAVTLTEESLHQGFSNKHFEARALNLQGTFKFIMSDAKGALAALDRSTDLHKEFTQSWIKKASVHMELGDPSGAENDFATATELNPNDPDIYYHRGQVMFITGHFEQAIEQYKKSTELDGTFIFSQIQHAVALYKDGRKERAEAKFKQLQKKFEDKPEVFNYYGELLLDQAANDPTKYAEAIKNFDQAAEQDKKKHGYLQNVLPLINKALCVFQSDKDRLAEAEEICRDALKIDPECDVGVATLAQLCLQQNKIQQAAGHFERSADLARTEPELIAALTYLNATKAQIYFIEAYPEQALAAGVVQADGQ